MSTGPQPFPLPSDTRHLNLESRQYRLLGVDLGHGWPRSAFRVGAAFFLPWWLLLWQLGVPPLANGGLLAWLGPPLFLTRWAFTRDPGGRYRIYAWLDRIAYRIRRPRPIVNGGLVSPAPPRPLITHDDTTDDTADDADLTDTAVIAAVPDLDGEPDAQVA